MKQESNQNSSSSSVLVQQADQPIHVLHLVYSFGIGGLERIITNCIAAMPKHYQHTVVALTHADHDFIQSTLASIDRQCEVIELHKPDGQSWGTFIDFYRLLKRLKPRVLHTYNLAALEFQIVGFIARVPVRIHAEHGRDLSDPDGTNRKYRLLRRLVSPLTHAFVCVSQDLYRWLLDDVGVATSKAKRILNGVDTQTYCASASSSRKLNSRIVFGHVARLEGIKNQHNLIAAYAQACQVLPGFLTGTALHIVGEGSYRAALEAQAKASIAADNIIFSGAKFDMPEVYRSFDVFVLSSDAEGIPMTMLEAMACELPVLSTAVGGIPEVTQADYAHLVEAKSPAALAEGFLHMFAQAGRLPKMGAQARHAVETSFSQQNMLKQYQALYEGKG